MLVFTCLDNQYIFEKVVLLLCFSANMLTNYFTDTVFVSSMTSSDVQAKFFI